MFDNFTQAELQDIQSLMKACANDDPAIAQAAQRKFAKAVEVPLRKVLLSGNIINTIFTTVPFAANQRVEFPLDLLVPGQESEFAAFVVPDHGELPQRRVEGDYIMIPTYMIGNSINILLRIVEDANWPVVQRAIEILEAGVVKKMNDDGWQTILAAAADRNVLINDPNAAAGQFTPRLVTLLKTFMRRNGGGNSTTLNRAKVTDIYVSPESKDDIRSWGLDQVADNVRSNIYYSGDDGSEVMRLFDVNIHDLDELGEGQEYQTYFTGTLAGSMAASDFEIVVALDQQRSDTFVMPQRKPFTVWENNLLHPQGLFGLYGRGEYGMSVLDSRRCLLGSL